MALGFLSQQCAITPARGQGGRGRGGEQGQALWQGRAISQRLSGRVVTGW